jgi:hypothetical protein
MLSINFLYLFVSNQDVKRSVSIIFSSNTLHIYYFFVSLSDNKQISSL